MKADSRASWLTRFPRKEEPRTDEEMRIYVYMFDIHNGAGACLYALEKCNIYLIRVQQTHSFTFPLMILTSLV